MTNKAFTCQTNHSIHKECGIIENKSFLIVNRTHVGVDVNTCTFINLEISYYSILIRSSFDLVGIWVAFYRHKNPLPHTHPHTYTHLSLSLCSSFFIIWRDTIFFSFFFSRVFNNIALFTNALSLSKWKDGVFFLHASVCHHHHCRTTSADAVAVGIIIVVVVIMMIALSLMCSIVHKFASASSNTTSNNITILALALAQSHFQIRIITDTLPVIKKSLFQYNS